MDFGGCLSEQVKDWLGEPVDNRKYPQRFLKTLYDHYTGLVHVSTISPTTTPWVPLTCPGPDLGVLASRDLQECSWLHKASVTCVDTWHDVAVSGHADGTVKMQSTRSAHNPVRSVDLGTTVTDIRLLSAHACLASTAAGTVSMLSSETSGFPATLHDMQEAGPVTCLLPHPSGSHAYYGVTNDSFGCVNLLDLGHGRCYSVTFNESAHSGKVLCMASASDGSLLITGGQDGTVKFFDGRSSSLVNDLKGTHGGEPVTSLEVSDSYSVLTGGLDGVGRVIETRMGQVLPFSFSSPVVTSDSTAIYSRLRLIDQNTVVMAVASATRASSVTFHDAATGSELSQVGPLRDLTAMGVSPVAGFAVGLGNTVRMYSMSGPSRYSPTPDRPSFEEPESEEVRLDDLL
ncbi:MAG: hypothetical protein KVP17_002238 [Porospora cf. gigantea B]|uniref:uncharacterized protein n=1 Tax=Porospora cf. gigantea B TaxID=2853592 RepID=UPI003571CB59|nr:MAG: hypothetical protein KVP17_002238 [Porospora cf. gigantea B]